MINLSQYNLIVVNSSGGKDSLCALWEVARIANIQGYPSSQIIVSHQDLGDMEWKGTKDLCQEQADLFGFRMVTSKRRNASGEEESLLEYIERRGMWPANKQRFCTSDFKRGPGQRIITQLSKNLGECNILQVFGFRKDESPSRAKKETLIINERASSKKRTVTDWLPIHDWSTLEVWATIKANKLPYHKAYDLGMPRLSCCFCIFSPFDALVVAGKNNPELLDRYVQVEKKIGHTFRNDLAIAEIQEAISQGYEPKKVTDWKM